MIPIVLAILGGFLAGLVIGMVAMLVWIAKGWGW
jgi:hypothetical protein